MAEFPNTGVWHSALAQAGRKCIMFTSPPRKSKFAGKPDFICMQVYGDNPAGKEYQLNIENDAIKAVLAAAPQQTWLMVEAGGSREQAYIRWMTVEDYDKAVEMHGGELDELPDVQVPAAPPPPAAPPATAAPVGRPGVARPSARQATVAAPAAAPAHTNGNGRGASNTPPPRKPLSVDYYQCLTAARDIINHWNSKYQDLPLEAEQLPQIAATLFIEYNRSGRTATIHQPPPRVPAGTAADYAEDYAEAHSEPPEHNAFERPW